MSTGRQVLAARWRGNVDPSVQPPPPQAQSQPLDPVGRGMPFQFPVHPRHPALRQFYDYWLTKCRDGRIPGRDKIDPVEMRSFLRYVIMFDVERHPRCYRFRHRLVGTHIVELFAQDVTGGYVDEASSAEEYPNVYLRLAPLVDRRVPVHALHTPPAPPRA